MVEHGIIQSLQVERLQSTVLLIDLKVNVKLCVCVGVGVYARTLCMCVCVVGGAEGKEVVCVWKEEISSVSVTGTCNHVATQYAAGRSPGTSQSW